jgi:hypothetical protein
MTEMDLKGMRTWEVKILRMYAPVIEQGIQRIKTNQEFRELFKVLYIVSDIKKRLDWFGDVVRMDHERQVRKYSRENQREVEGEDLD